MKKKILVAFGTRPEAIKMAPVVMQLKKSEWFEPVVCVSAQHRDMLDSVLSVFGIVPDFDLNIMKPGQDLSDITSRVMLGLRDVIRKVKPSMLLVHGDTTTCLAAGLSAFYEKVPVGHVEAGLRTRNLSAPFPEEANRTLVAPLCALHFAPTSVARKNLMEDNVGTEKISITGNSGIDALFLTKDKLDHYQSSHWIEIFGEDLFGRLSDKRRDCTLITAHRRENLGAGIKSICSAVAELADRNENCDFIFPVHKNPAVQEPVNQMLSGRHNVHLIAPLDYGPFVWVLDKCNVCLTDSGGIQEEAPSLGTPVLVMRDVTERPEAIEWGVVKLVGTNKQKIVSEVERAISSSADSLMINPYGDGRASQRIMHCIENFFGAKRKVKDFQPSQQPNQPVAV